jgi:hypothetical protein
VSDAAGERVAQSLYGGDSWDDMPETYKQGCRDDAERMIAVYRRALADAGYVIVPREPTPEMTAAGAKECGPVDSRFDTSEGCASDVWFAMIEGAPEP